MAGSLKKRLEELLKQPDNQFCADCGGRGPRWASANIGVFICIGCSGIHRNLGVHISFVRSVNLDDWTVEQVEVMEEWGNGRARLYYEANLPPGFQKPTEHSSQYELQRWIRDKYEYRKYSASQIPPRQSSYSTSNSTDKQETESTPRPNYSRKKDKKSSQEKEEIITDKPKQESKQFSKSSRIQPVTAEEPNLLDFSQPDQKLEPPENTRATTFDNSALFGTTQTTPSDNFQSTFLPQPQLSFSTSDSALYQQQLQFSQQSQFPQQAQFQQGQFPHQAQFAQQVQFSQQAQFAQQGQFPQQAQFAQQGQFSQQAQFQNQQPQQVPQQNKLSNDAIMSMFNAPQHNGQRMGMNQSGYQISNLRTGNSPMTSLHQSMVSMQNVNMGYSPNYPQNFMPNGNVPYGNPQFGINSYGAQNYPQAQPNLMMGMNNQGNWGGMNGQSPQFNQSSFGFNQSF